jgi:hypothetical protein
LGWLIFKGSSIHECEIPPRKDRRGFDFISDVLPFGRLRYSNPDDAIGLRAVSQSVI